MQTVAYRWRRVPRPATVASSQQCFRGQHEFFAARGGGSSYTRHALTFDAHGPPMQARRTTPHSITSILGWLHRVFDATATWVSQLSWWKFFLFAALALIAGKILQDELFSGGGEEVVIRSDKKPNKKDG